MTLLEVRGLAAGYGGREVVSDIGLDVGKAEIVALLGPNGAGKSTLLSAIAGLLRPLRGSVFLDGREVTGLEPAALAAVGAALVPQRRNVFRTLSVAENLAIGAWPDRAQAARRRDDVLALFPPLGAALRRPAGLLSGGQRQMLALGMALMAGPRLLLLDEPTAGLSPALVEEALLAVAALKPAGVAVLLVEQNAREALRHADRALVLAAGRMVREGSAEELLAAPDLGALFLEGAA
jgi:branched-chain amino acid transport system ATP-binding protein/neutral amino acid transport system ATP-binding protein